jgi:hypothetical protein
VNLRMPRRSRREASKDTDRSWLTQENVVATFAITDRVHEALLALEGAGIDGGDIRVGGEGVARSAQIAATNFDVLETALERRLGPRAAAGAAIGGTVGAVLSALGIALMGPHDVTAIIAAMIGFFVYCGAVGGLIGLFTGLATNRAWEATLVPVEGCSWILVSSSDPKVLDRAEQVLRKTAADRVVRVTRRGRPIAAASG